MNTPKNIFPEKDFLVSQEEKSKKLKQQPKVIWLTGLSGSGKSTVAKHLEKLLFDKGFSTCILDGDNIRSGLNNNLSFSEEDRLENIRRIAEVAKLFTDNGLICICAFVSPTKEIRQLAKNIITPERYIEVFINTPIDVCEERDVKGLYAKARKGEVKDFTGISAPFDTPESGTISITTSKTPMESAQELFEVLLPKLIL
jgi:adenylylsulfate kinase